MRWLRRRSPSPTRRELIDRKHGLEGEIANLSAEVRRLHQRGADAASQENRLTRLRTEHYQTRLAIDRSPIEQ